MRSTRCQDVHRRLRRPELLEARRLLAVFNVNTDLDTIDADLSDGLALDSEGNTSLRAAVMQANASAGDDQINLPSGNYRLSITGPLGLELGEDSFDDLDITDSKGSLSILGEGAAHTVIDATGIFSRVFQVTELAQLAVTGITISGGSTSDAGGGILSQGTLTLTAVHVFSNSAQSGGGIFHTGGDLTIAESTVSGNSAFGDGAGIALVRGPEEGSGSITISNSTLSGNAAPDGLGGGLYVAPDVTQAIQLLHVTIASNNALNGAGVAAPSDLIAPIHVLASIIADNLTSLDELDVLGIFDSGGSNVIGRAATASGFVDGLRDDIVGSAASPVSALLAPLDTFADSPTPVHRLLSTSVAVDHVNLIPPPLLLDQRGRSRLADAAPDSGAFEFVGGTLLIEAFHDVNRNGVFDPSENLAAFNAFAQVRSANWPATGLIAFAAGTTPIFVPRLDPGLYNIQASFDFPDRVLGTKLTASGYIFEEETGVTDPIGGFRYGEIHGEKFSDTLGDGIKSSDPPLSGVPFDLIELGPDLILGTDDDTFIGSDVSDANGRFSFLQLFDGNYVVLETVPDNTVITTDAIPVLTVAAGSLLVPSPGFVPPGTNQQEAIIPELSVGNALNAEIRGRVVFDAALDGWDTGDPGMATFELLLEDAGSDGVFGSSDDALVSTAVSNADGRYTLGGISAVGLYRLSLASKDHYFSTTPSAVEFQVRPGDVIISDAALSEPLVEGQTVVFNQNLAFGVMRYAGLWGLAFDDLNADGVRQDESGANLEPPRENQRIDVYRLGPGNNFELLDSTISLAAPSVQRGLFAFDDLARGQLVIDQVLSSERGLTTREIPFEVDWGTVYVAPGTSGSISSTFPLRDFEEGIVKVKTLDLLQAGSRELVELTGNIVDDLNADGIANAGEVGLEGWSVVVARTERQYTQDTLPPVRSVLTDANGDYALRVWPGVYHVAEILQPAYEPTGPSYRFEDYVGYSTGGGPSVSKVSAIDLVDLNNDGVDEIIVANDFADIVDRTSSLDVFYSQADGSWQRVVLDLGTGMRPQHIVATDLDDDQDADVVVAAIGGGGVDPQAPSDLAFGDVIVFRNDDGVLNRLDANGNIATNPPRGGRDTRPVADANHGNSPSHVSVGFLNADRLADLVVTNLYTYDPLTNSSVQHVEDVSVILQTAPGVFSKRQTIDLSTANVDAQVISTTTGDFNDDGKQDIAIGAPGFGSVELYFGVGDGTFEAVSDRSLSGLSRPVHLLSHDMDLNGFVDLLVTDYAENEVLIYHQSADGLSNTPIRVPTAAKPQWLAVGDINADGSPDMLVSLASTNVVQPIFNVGSQTYAPSGNSEAGSNLQFSATAPNGLELAFGKIAVGNVDGDAFSDAVIAHFTSGATVHANLVETLETWLASHPDSEASMVLGDSHFEDFQGAGITGGTNFDLSGQLMTVGHSKTLVVAQFDQPGFVQVLAVPAFANYNTLSSFATNQVLSTASVERPYHNYGMPLDVNQDDSITPIDVLWIVNAIHAPVEELAVTKGKVDVSGDGQITPLDVLLVINYLNDMDSDPPLYARSQQASVAGIQAVASLMIDRLVATGLSDAAAVDLRNLSWEVVDLPSNVLARTAGRRVFVDVNAAGWGWLTEPTLPDRLDFPEGRDATFLGQVDLLSTIAHELGHALGLSEDPDPTSIMHPRLNLGERKLSSQTIDQLLAEQAPRS